MMKNEEWWVRKKGEKERNGERMGERDSNVWEFCLS